MNEKDNKIIEIFEQVLDALVWINAGGSDIQENVDNVCKKLSELKGIQTDGNS